MLRHYILTTYRVLTRHKLQNLINIISLAIGLIAAALIQTYVQYESSFDTHWQDDARIFRAHTRYTPAGVTPLYDAWTPYRLKFMIEDEFPDVEHVGLSEPSVGTLRYKGESFTQNIYVAGDKIFDVFRFESLNGQPLPALPDVKSLYLSESTAQKYFGAEDPVGKVVEFDTGFTNEFQDFVVRGVFKELPANSHLQVKALRRYNTDLVDPLTTGWTRFSTFTYLKVREGVSKDDLEQRFLEIKERIFPPRTLPDGRYLEPAKFLHFEFLNVKELHFDNARGDVSGALTPPRGDKDTVHALRLVALIILFIAAINFINLTTARATLRAKEVALRKTLGGKKLQLVAQFLFETAVLGVIAAAIAAVALILVTPFFAQILDRPLEFQLFGNGGFGLYFAALVLGLIFFSGLYPSIYLSRFQPSDVLRANRSSPGRLSLHLRQGLVVTQFAASIALIIGTYFVYAQVHYASNFERGFELDGQLILRDVGRFHDPGRAEKSEQARARIEQLDVVEHASLTWAVPSDDLTFLTQHFKPGFNERALMDLALVDPHYAETLGVDLIAGRFLDDDVEKDRYVMPPTRDTTYNIVINRKGLESLGFETADEAVGAVIKDRGYDREKNERFTFDVTIVGVVDDVQYGSIRGEIGPTVYEYQPRRLYNIVVRFVEGADDDAYEQVKRTWDEVAPEFPFEAVYLSEELGKHYKADQQRANMFVSFTLLAIILSVIGVLGLSSFSVDQRRKEIGIRRVLGASSARITSLISWQFARFVLISNLVGWPLAYFGTQYWLEGFHERIDIGLLPFVLSGLSALVLAWLVVSFIVLTALRDNPVEALRNE